MPNRIVLAAAGSGKTDSIVQETLGSPEKRILITTYTNGNAEQIRSRLSRSTGVLPKDVQVLTWFRFLLRDGIKPYQSVFVGPFFARSVDFESEKPLFVRQADTLRYYFTANRDVYRDRAADLAYRIACESGGRSIQRLEGMYDTIYIDELQDLSGYDLDFLQLLLSSRMPIVAVGDPRQVTYHTTRSSKNKQYCGVNLLAWVKKQTKNGRAILRTLAVSHRCNQAICDFADALFPEMTSTCSLNHEVTGHDGVFLVHSDDIPQYVQRFAPTPLRYKKDDRAANDSGLIVHNIGDVKGKTFDRVLVFPTEPMRKYLRTGSAGQVGDRPRLYVAVTRAKYSVAFVVSQRGFRTRLATMWQPNGGI